MGRSESCRAYHSFVSLQLSDAGGLTSALAPTARTETRRAFAAAWLDVVQHEEWQRQRAAVFLAAANANEASPTALAIPTARNAYIPREGDRTVAELIRAFKAERDARHGEESTDRKYNHIFRCLEEVLDRPSRSAPSPGKMRAR